MARFLARLTLFLALLALLQELVGPWSFPPIMQSLEALAAERPPLLFLGDSSVFRVDPGDLDRRSTAEMLGERRGLAVGSLVGGAHTSELWVCQVRELLRRGIRFDRVVAVVNLRSFSPSWDLEPLYQFTDERTFLGLPPYLRPFLRPLVAFKAVDFRPESAGFLDAPVYDGTTQVGQVRDYRTLTAPPAERERRMLLYFYMAALRGDHRKLRSLAELADLLRAAGVRLLCYVTPIDVERGSFAFGSRFRRQIGDNVRTIEAELTPRGAVVLDLCCGLPDSQFSYASFPNEHLKATGRAAVASALATELGTR